MTFLFPHFIIIKASAGAGKTFELTKRLAQFLILPNINHREFKNILAITFSNMATKEMKERTIYWLKALALKDNKAFEHFSKMLFIDKDAVFEKKIELDKEKISKRAEDILSQILIHYNDLQIKTIDSFMASIFSSMSLNLGYYGDFEILLNNERFLQRAFDIFLNERIVDGFVDKGVLKDIEDALSSSSSSATFNWDLYRETAGFFLDIYRKTTAIVGDLSEEVLHLDELIERIKKKYYEIDDFIEKKNLKRKDRCGFVKLGEIIRNKTWNDIPGISIKSPPVNQDKSKNEYNKVCERWNDLVLDIANYTLIYSKNYYSKVVALFNSFKDVLDKEKLKASYVFIEDINKILSDKIKEDWVPDIYFLLGETIYHYFIDEFQDTSPIQWQCLKPLLENSLSQGGSVFIVGDTKQAIYGFRNTDWQIMKGLIDREESGFEPSKPISYELTENNRSGEAVITFNETVFKKNVKNNEKYCVVADKVGLTNYVQKKSDNVNYEGYVECILIEQEKNELEQSVKKQLNLLIHELSGRNYQYKDIAILVEKNNQVVDVANWLLSLNIPAISFSSLDIRKRPVIMEIFSLLSFLNKPTSNIDFAAFLQSDLFIKASMLNLEDVRNFLFEHRDEKQLYTVFRNNFRESWDKLIEKLFSSVGYMPIYSLLSEIYKVFNVFEYFKMEEGSLIKLLEVVSEFENSDVNNLTDFLKDVEEDEDETKWDLSFPENLDAVKIMTIHKSKGLGFPVVISLLYEHSEKHDTLWIPRKGNEKRLVKINKKWTDKNDTVNEWYEEKKALELSNNLNSLYVCLTRAKRELYVIGVMEKKDEDKNNAKKFPLDVINFPSYVGEKMINKDKAIESFEVKPLYINPKKDVFSFQEKRQQIKTDKTQRGDFVHEVLKYIKIYDYDFRPFVENVIKKLKTTKHFTADINREYIENFIKNETVLPFFKKVEGREVYTELEFVDKYGRLFRCDRLVVDKDQVKVIDFKTGEERNEDYKKQIKEYIDIAKSIWKDKEVKGFIVYFDNLKVYEVFA